MQRFYFVLFLLSLSILPLFSYAQTPGSIDSIEIRVTPENPKPLQTVTIKVESFLTDLNKATIIWFVDNKQSLTGIGETVFSLPAPQNSKKSVVSILITTIEGKKVRRSVELHPGDVSITWEAQTYTPAIYNGKAIPSYQSSVKFVAMPELFTKSGSRIDPKTLIYTWKKNSTVLGSQSGYGRQSAVIQGGVIPEAMTVSVTVQSKDGSIGGEAAISSDFYDPEIIFYKEDPLYGILYNHALRDQEPLTNDELKVVGVPYFFSDRGPSMWNINNTDRPELSNQKSITFRNKGDVGGSSLISLEIRGVSNILQSAKSSFTVYFNKK